jgi:dienelactone hydrolase
MVTRLAVALAALAASLALAPAAEAAPTPFGHACVPQSGVRFCPTVQLGDRVASWDGTPLDVDVTLPPAGDGPFPTLVMEHGFPGTKETYQATSPEGDNAGTYHDNNVFYAQQGYAVVTLSARGFGRSCGVPESRTSGCERGWTHIADHRFEVRDVQYLLGRLVDQGVARPDALGVTGLSGGGGRTVALAFLRDRIRLPGGELVPWRSPAGTPLRIAAAYGRWVWDDLASALAPNGRLRDDRTGRSLSPLGVFKRRWIDLLYIGGAGPGFIAPPGADPQADITNWRDATRADPDGSESRGIARLISRFIGGAAGIEGGTPAPIVLANGFTDELFPADEALRVAARARAAGGTARVMLGDFGHGWAGNVAVTQRTFNDAAAGFLRLHLQPGTGGRDVDAATVYVSSCPKGEAGRLLSAPDGFDELARDRVVLRGRGSERIGSRGGSRTVATALDGASGDWCKGVASRRDRRAATYERRSRGDTMVGSPAITARVRVRGDGGQLAARLWDVDDGRQRLIARGVYRLEDDQRGRIRFQLHPNAYRFARGNRIRLELLGRDEPYAQRSDERFTVTVSRLRLSLPVR